VGSQKTAHVIKKLKTLNKENVEYKKARNISNKLDMKTFN
jgi:hypothetical protein